MVDFEMKMSGCDRDTAKNRINEIVGERVFGGAGEKPEAIYQYHDANGRLLFEKLRYACKRFVQRRRNDKGGWEYKLGNIPKPISIAVLNGAGKLVMESIVETKAATLVQFLQGLPGELHVTLEEGAWAAWLYEHQG